MNRSQPAAVIAAQQKLLEAAHRQQSVSYFNIKRKYDCHVLSGNVTMLDFQAELNICDLERRIATKATATWETSSSSSRGSATREDYAKASKNCGTYFIFIPLG